MAATDYAQTVKNDTREFISLAILQLLKKEKLSTLSVSKVCKRAGVSRMAFYRNFSDLSQVLHEYYQPKISAEFDVVRNQPLASVKIERQEIFFERFGDDFILAEQGEFEPIIRSIFTEEIKKFYVNSEDDYWVAFMAAGVYAIWHKWLLEDKKRPLKEVHALIKNFGIK
ncbi:TetR/AcrR family transcriptional regulator [Lactococcus protaetiae]|uniref:TetR/AcrR family transcriptional regulator n=1 Tax=Lactococcus protaetiae TaxID=2592653 RepID=A0A514ZAF8_9LACT|nr:TetR/AcrR family transcriptional regulator [Lactococcus protaetiae]MCL2112498.1 TetR/AcrR family transcriptional regulator [Streptococcaceae bacterium]QDK71572.1 TetR/AcrR family transcriptional regulator [Lactococcus protaetiae]